MGQDHTVRSRLLLSVNKLVLESRLDSTTTYGGMVYLAKCDPRLSNESVYVPVNEPAAYRAPDTKHCGGASGSKRSTLDIEGKIQEWRSRSQPTAPPAPAPGSPGTPARGSPQHTRLLLGGAGVTCQLLPPPALLDDLKTRLDHKDEDNESGIHESE